MFYDPETSQALTETELNSYGIYILTKHKATSTTNAGFGGLRANGNNSNTYGILATNMQSAATYDNITRLLSDNQNELLRQQAGGKYGNATLEPARGGGGGASNFASGGNGGGENSDNGKPGSLGSGGGGGSPDGNGGKGGLPYIFFCSNIDFDINVS